MKKLIYLSLILLSGVFVFNSCSDDDDYDWKNYQPVVVGTINGAASVAAHGFTDYPAVYEMSYLRAGSSFEWTVTTFSGAGSATVTLEEVDGCPGKKASIIFPQRSTLDTAYVSVVEVSSKGVKSDPKVKKVLLNPFCPLTIDDFVGTFSAVETRSGIVRNTSVVIVKENATTLRVKVQAGIPGFLPSVFVGWGELFINGYGLNGDILMSVGLVTGIVTFTPGTYWGRTDYDYDYWYTGSGSWSGCTQRMNVAFQLHWDNANFTDAGDRSCTVVIDLSSKK